MSFPERNFEIKVDFGAYLSHTTRTAERENRCECAKNREICMIFVVCAYIQSKLISRSSHPVVVVSQVREI
jgi:hypothetical protein